MSPRRLLTLLHISDTHIAEPDAHAAGGRLEPWVRGRFHRGHAWYGFLGHSSPALESLGRLARRLRDDEGAQIVHSGDLTSWGGPGQFAAALEILPAALGSPSALDLAIPGNHDHWPGDGGVFGRPSAALRETFPVLPWVRRIPLGRGRLLTLAAIDSDADVFPWGYARLWGRGRFQSQLAALDSLLPRPVPGEFRALLLHHSPWRAQHRLGVSAGSRLALDAFLPRHDIRVLLCGHVHVPRCEVRACPHGDVLEARCGTTTQRDFVPAEWLAGARGRLPGLPRNSLLVHRVIEDDGTGDVWWDVEVQELGRWGFEPVGGRSRIRLLDPRFTLRS